MIHDATCRSIVAALSLLVEPRRPLSPLRASKRSPRRRRQFRKPLTQARAGRSRRSRPPPPQRPRTDRRRLAAHLRPAERRQHPRLPAAGRELGQADAPRRLQRRVATAPRAATSRRSAPIKLEADTQVALAERLVSFQKHEDRRGQLPDAAEGTACARSPAADRQGDSRRRARDRARPRARQPRQEPDRAEERRGRQGRSAADLLQQDAGGHRQPRRRADLEPDQGQRSEVRGQHELGSVPARADQHALPAQQRHAG